MSSKERLQSRVNAVNNANKYAIELRPKLLAAFKPFVGSKIIKKDGTLLGSVDKCVPEFEYNSKVRVYQSRSKYTIGYTVNYRESIETYTAYHETTIIIGNLEGQVLTSLEEYDGDWNANRRTDYTVDEIVQKRKKYEQLQEAADQARYSLSPFGECDR